jgi:predicted alpha/beta-fold hydrolase
VWGPLFRRDGVARRRERVTTPDGDFLDLDWLAEPAATRAPLLLVLHGLEGSGRSHYAAGLLREASLRGWRAAVLNFRSCSGELNRLPRFYHSGETGDLDFVVDRLVRRERDLILYAVGVSLGGNVLLKWLGERGAGAPAALRGAVGISVPFDLAACAAVLDRGFRRRIYTENFLRTLRSKVARKARDHPGFVDVPAALAARTFAEYDAVVTAPLGGFADAADYWARSSSGPWLGHIRRPTLLLNARDDPFVPVHTLPDPQSLPAHVRAEFTDHGGHAGFIEGRTPWRVTSWAEGRALDFLAGLPAPAPVC